MNSAGISRPNAASRAATKSSVYYRNDEWDVVDAVKGGKKLEEMKEAELPEVMQKMSKDERKAYVEKNAKKRQEIQKQIQVLNDARKKHIADERKKLKGADKSLGSAMIKVVRKQAETRKFKFEESKPKPAPEKK